MPELDGVSIPDGWLALRNPNYPNPGDFSEGTRRAPIDEDLGISALFGPLSDEYGTQAGLLKVRFALFDQSRWPGQAACEDWLEQHRGALKFLGGGTGRRILHGQKDLSVALIKAFGPVPDEKDLALIHSYAIEPYPADAYYVRRMNLCNTQADRAFERFTRSNLRQFAQSAVGKGMLLGHDYQTVPLGRFYKATTERDSETDVTHLQPSFFMSRQGASDAIANIDTGVWKDVSIGFNFESVQCDICGADYMDIQGCKHYAGEWYGEDDVTSRGHPDELKRDGDQVLCTVNFGTGKVEMLEGSIVWLGCQYDAELVKAKEALRTLDPPSDIHGVKRFGLEARTHYSIPEGEPGAPPASGTSGAIPGEGGDAMDEALQKELDSTKQQLAEAMQALDAERAKGADLEQAGKELKAAAEAAQSEAEAYKAPVLEDIARLAKHLDREAELAIWQESTEGFSKSSPERVLALRDDWQKKWDETAPPRQQSKASDPEADAPKAEDEPRDETGPKYPKAQM